VTTRDVYHHALAFVKEKKPDLEKHFVKNVGFSVRSLTICVFDLLMLFRLGLNFATPPIFYRQKTREHCERI
jgi:hypothetical protein